MGKVNAPELLNPQHEICNFDCEIPVLNDWLQKQALKNNVSGASRTYVVCENQEVVGYYALATGSVSRQEATGNIRRKMPEPIPIIVLGRLAVDIRWQGTGIGAGLLKDAVARSLSVSLEVGVRALLVHALDEKAKGFYAHHGFVESPIDPMIINAKPQIRKKQPDDLLPIKRTRVDLIYVKSNSSLIASAKKISPGSSCLYSYPIT